MATEELEYIEILIDYLTSNNPNFNIDLEFEKQAKNNLFNRLSINILLANYTNQHNFNIANFFKNGTIDNFYTNPIEVPTISSKYKINYEDIIKKIIEALKNNYYVFDKRANIVVGDNDFEATIPAEWLYRLAMKNKTEIKEEVVLFTKKHERSLKNKQELEKYLYEIKSIIIRFKNPSKKYKQELNEIREKIKLSLRLNRHISVNDMIKAYNFYLENTNDIEILKNNISYVDIIKKANNKNLNFYKKSITAQKAWISKWILDLKNVNTINNSLTQLFLLVTKKESIYEQTKNQVLIALINQYLLILGEYKLDMNDVSLSDFKIKEYRSKKQQEQLIKLNDIIRKIDEYTDLDNQDFLQELKQKRNSIQNIILYERENNYSDIAFDNEKIYSLLCECIKNGQVYQNPENDSEIIYRLQNSILGKNVFLASIKKDKLIDFIKTCSISLKEKKTLS